MSTNYFDGLWRCCYPIGWVHFARTLHSSSVCSSRTINRSLLSRKLFLTRVPTRQVKARISTDPKIFAVCTILPDVRDVIRPAILRQKGRVRIRKVHRSVACGSEPVLGDVYLRIYGPLYKRTSSVIQLSIVDKRFCQQYNLQRCLMKLLLNFLRWSWIPTKTWSEITQRPVSLAYIRQNILKYSSVYASTYVRNNLLVVVPE